jgi:hypothetical protein
MTGYFLAWAGAARVVMPRRGNVWYRWPPDTRERRPP